jgi:flagellar biosynthesis protein FlhF
MRLHTYRVPSMQEGMAKIKRDLGADAMIIEARKVRRNGWRGYFLPKITEITVAVEGERNADHSAASDSQHFHKELAAIRAMVESVVNIQKQSKDSIESSFQRMLLDQDVAGDVAAEILAGLNAAGQDNVSIADVQGELEMKIASVIKAAPIHDDTRFISFVGPTGVGKTTTLAKLAAEWVFFKKKKIALVTMDTYRIGAIDQLKKYAEIAGIPLHVVLTKEDFTETLTKLARFDTVFIDTAGRSPGNQYQIHETAQMLNELPNLCTCLVVSATTKCRDLEQLISAYRPCRFDRLIVTKLDETQSYGIILNLAHMTKLPIAYLTTGQNVPEDIEGASSRKIAAQIVEAMNHD